MIDYQKLIDKVPRDVWFSSSDLEHLWNVEARVRKLRVCVLVKKGLLRTKGKTVNIRYKRTAPKTFTGVIPTTGNGVIDAKLRKEANLPDTPSSLENLIAAATKVGTENEILKQALKEIDAIVVKVQEHL